MPIKTSVTSVLIAGEVRRGVKLEQVVLRESSDIPFYYCIKGKGGGSCVGRDALQ